jgi:hypothetical protein
MTHKGRIQSHKWTKHYACSVLAWPYACEAFPSRNKQGALKGFKAPLKEFKAPLKELIAPLKE